MCFMSTCLMLKVFALYKEYMVGWTILEAFRSEFDIENEDDFRISIQLRSHIPHTSISVSDQLKRGMRLV